jgi:hypothetical protein
MKIRLFILFLFVKSIISAFGQTPNEALLVLKKAQEIEIRGTFPTDVRQVTVKITSERNKQMTKITDISPRNPDPSTVVPTPRPNKEIWYPVIDMRLQVGTKAMVQLTEKPTL